MHALDTPGGRSGVGWGGMPVVAWMNAPCGALGTVSSRRRPHPATVPALAAAAAPAAPAAEVTARLSDKELLFARDYFVLFGTHMKAAAANHLPGGWWGGGLTGCQAGVELEASSWRPQAWSGFQPIPASTREQGQALESSSPHAVHLPPAPPCPPRPPSPRPSLPPPQTPSTPWCARRRPTPPRTWCRAPRWTPTSSAACWRTGAT